MRFMQMPNNGANEHKSSDIMTGKVQIVEFIQTPFRSSYLSSRVTYLKRTIELFKSQQFIPLINFALLNICLLIVLFFGS